MFGVPLHRLLVHFPIVLALCALLYDAWAVSSGDRSWHRTGSGLTMGAALAAVAATFTGLDRAGVSGLGSGSIVAGHAGFALAGTVILTALAFVRYAAEARADAPEDAYSRTWLAAQGGAAGLILIAAVMGHRIG